MDKFIAHILVVDDDDGIRSLVKKYLNENDFLVTTSDNAEDASNKVQIIKFDLIILDVMMPGKSGLDFLKEYKARLDTPIILLTAKGEASERVEGLEIGADDYLPKPFEPKELILRIKAILKRGQKKEDVLEVERQFGDLSIDIESHEVHVNNDQIDLTALEFRLLRQLVDRRGRVQSRDQLLSDVWGYSTEVTTRTVDTHIKRLREKLGPMGKYVQTIRGVGYKFSRSPD